jgi:membrane-associated protein
VRKEAFANKREICTDDVVPARPALIAAGSGHGAPATLCLAMSLPMPEGDCLLSVPETDSAQPGKGADPWNDPRLPWNGRPQTADILCWAGIVLAGLFYWALLPFRVRLVGTHPLVSELLNGSIESIISAAAFVKDGHGTLAVVLLAAIPGLVKFDPLYWWAGRLWGERVLALMPGSRRALKYMDRVRQAGRKFLWPAVVISYFLPIPSAIIYVIAGWAGMRLVTFLILDIIGALLWAGLLAGLGYSLGHHAVVVAKTISHYSWWFTIGFVVLTVFFVVRSQRRLMRETAAAEGPGQSDAAAEGPGQSEAASPSTAAPASAEPSGG